MRRWVEDYSRMALREPGDEWASEYGQRAGGMPGGWAEEFEQGQAGQRNDWAAEFDSLVGACSIVVDCEQRCSVPAYREVLNNRGDSALRHSIHDKYISLRGGRLGWGFSLCHCMCSMSIVTSCAQLDSSTA